MVIDMPHLRIRLLPTMDGLKALVGMRILGSLLPRRA